QPPHESFGNSRQGRVVDESGFAVRGKDSSRRGAFGNAGAARIGQGPDHAGLGGERSLRGVSGSECHSAHDCGRSGTATGRTASAGRGLRTARQHRSIGRSPNRRLRPRPAPQPIRPGTARIVKTREGKTIARSASEGKILARSASEGKILARSASEGKAGTSDESRLVIREIM